MTKKLFGTDGVRGLANHYPMTPEMAMLLGQAIAYHFKQEKPQNKIIIGKDTRRSSYMLEQAIAAGVCSMGSFAVLTGPLPTPAIGFLAKAMRADAGVMISASHNSFQDNGIKFFDQDGFKLSDAIELELEEFVFSKIHQVERPVRDEIGQAKRIADAQGRYIEFVKSTFPKSYTLEGLKVVIDCANGAAYRVAPAVLEELGAEVIAIGVKPDGTNINLGCGATDTRLLQETVVKNRAQVGMALDGDADRVIFCDEKGTIIDGDKVIAICAQQLMPNGKGISKKVVGTIMTNMGVENYLKEKGIELVRTRVGDRYIIERMREENIVLGGEPSGHIIFSQYTTTGDGLLAGLQVLANMLKLKATLSELASQIPLYPQVQQNIHVKSKVPIENFPEISNALSSLEERSKNSCRAIVRYSGTEPVLRLMIEGKDEILIQKELQALSEIVQKKMA